MPDFTGRHNQSCSGFEFTIMEQVYVALIHKLPVSNLPGNFFHYSVLFGTRYQIISRGICFIGQSLHVPH